MNILFLTEDAAERALLKAAIANISPDYTLTASEAIGDFWAKLTSQQVPLPNLIFLDFDLSRSYDHELVPFLKGNDDLKAAPVIVLADYADTEEITAMYKSHIACFVIVPVIPELRQRTIQVCLEFWLTYGRLPDHVASTRCKKFLR